MIGLKVYGKFVSPQHPIFGGNIAIDRTGYGPYEKFYVVECPGNTICLRSFQWGTYLSAQGDGTLKWDRPAKRPWEQFQVVRHGDRIALKSVHGRFVAAYGNTLYANSYGGDDVSQLFTVYPDNCLG